MLNLIPCTSFMCLEAPRNKPARQCRIETEELLNCGKLTSDWWSQHITKRIIALLLVNGPFGFPFARTSSPCSPSSSKEPRGCSKNCTRTCPVSCVLPHAVSCVSSPGWAAISSHPSATLLPVSSQNQLCSLPPKNCSSLSKGALNLLTQLCFSHPSYLTEWRKTSNSSRTTSSPSCNILIFSWLLRASLNFSRI